MATDTNIPGAAVGDEPGRKAGDAELESSRRDELGPEAGEEQVQDEAVSQAENLAALQAEIDDSVEGSLAKTAEAASETVDRKIEEGLDIELGEDSDSDTDTGADADAQLTPEEQAALDAAKKAANAAAGGGAIAGAFGWISDNLKKVFAWISEKIGGLFGKLGFKKKEEKSEEDAEGAEGESAVAAYEGKERFKDSEVLHPNAPIFTFPSDSSPSFSSPYSMRDLHGTGDWKSHNGVDISAPNRTPIVCTKNGCEVIRSQWSDTGGNYVYLRMPDGKVACFLHLDEPGPEVGTKINKGEVIGLIGDTGHSFGAHLHFEIQATGNMDHLDPSDYLYDESIRSDELAKRESRTAEYDAFLRSPRLERDDEEPPVPLV